MARSPHALDHLDHLDANNLAAAVPLAGVSDGIRGYGPVKEGSVVLARAKREELLAAFDQTPKAATLAA